VSCLANNLCLLTLATMGMFVTIFFLGCMSITLAMNPQPGIYIINSVYDATFRCVGTPTWYAAQYTGFCEYTESLSLSQISRCNSTTLTYTSCEGSSNCNNNCIVDEDPSWGCKSSGNYSTSVSCGELPSLENTFSVGVYTDKFCLNTMLSVNAQQLNYCIQQGEHYFEKAECSSGNIILLTCPDSTCNNGCTSKVIPSGTCVENTVGFGNGYLFNCTSSTY